MTTLHCHITIDPDDGRKIFWLDTRDEYGALVAATPFATREAAERALAGQG